MPACLAALKDHKHACEFGNTVHKLQPRFFFGCNIERCSKSGASDERQRIQEQKSIQASSRNSNLAIMCVQYQLRGIKEIDVSERGNIITNDPLGSPVQNKMTNLSEVRFHKHHRKIDRLAYVARTVRMLTNAVFQLGTYGNLVRYWIKFSEPDRKYD